MKMLMRSGRLALLQKAFLIILAVLPAPIIIFFLLPLLVIQLRKQFAKQAIISEQLGADSITDLLTVSFSSTDYVGHSFGPNSVEAEDIYLRLDKDLGDFFNFLDNTVGKGQYVLFLSADHGAAHVPAFAKDHNIPAGNMDFSSLLGKMNAALNEKFGQNNLIADIANYQVSLNLSLIASSVLKNCGYKKWLIRLFVKTTRE